MEVESQVLDYQTMNIGLTWTNQERLLMIGYNRGRLEIGGVGCTIVVKVNYNVIEIVGDNCLLVVEMNLGRVLFKGDNNEMRLVNVQNKGRIDSFGEFNRINGSVVREFMTTPADTSSLGSSPIDFRRAVALEDIRLDSPRGISESQLSSRYNNSGKGRVT